jgi:hypothetical protein
MSFLSSFRWPLGQLISSRTTTNHGTIACMPSRSPEVLKEAKSRLEDVLNTMTILGRISSLWSVSDVAHCKPHSSILSANSLSSCSSLDRLTLRSRLAPSRTSESGSKRYGSASFAAGMPCASGVSRVVFRPMRKQKARGQNSFSL